jgi:serine protease Do
MNSSITTSIFFVSTCFGVWVAASLMAHEPDRASQQIEAQLQRLYETVSPAIVRLAEDEKAERSILAAGVIVSSQGHITTIVGPERQDLKVGQSLFCFLSDGRHCRCKVLGTSRIYNIALLKIVEEGNWPHISFSKEKALPAGQLCATFDYSWGDIIGQEPRESAPALRVGSITRAVFPRWFTTSCISESSRAVFSLNGELIGLTSVKYGGHDLTHTPVSVLLSHWDALAAGKNIDREILFGDKQSSPAKQIPATSKARSDEHSISELAKQNAIAATVRIRTTNSPTGWSGVIVSGDGYVTTCAHRFDLPGTPVTVELSDGRNVAGKVVGTNWVEDIQVVKITDAGIWPHVEMDASDSVSLGNPCWLIGYPAKDQLRTPAVRQAKIANPNDNLAWSPLLYADHASEIFGGDSGGGMFNSQGNLVGILSGRTLSDFVCYRRIERIKNDWEFFSANRPVEVSTVPPRHEIIQAFDSPEISELQKIAVEILRDGKPCALGTVVGGSGKIATKSSELYGNISVRMPGGAVLPASVEKFSRPDDLAILRVAARDLVAATFAEQSQLKPGTLIAAVLPAGPSRVGSISYSVRALPTDRGCGLFDVADSKRGLAVVDDSSARNLGMTIQKGDIIKRIEGYDTPDLKSMLALLGDGNHAGTILTNAGDPLAVTVERDAAIVELRFPRPPTRLSRPETESRRYTGFPKVFDIDAQLDAKTCGGPVIDLKGRVVGITIATRGDDRRTTRVHVVPAAVVKEFVGE